MRVAIGNGLRTESGRLAVLVFSEYRPGDREVFVLERAETPQGGTQSAWAQVATVPASNNTGNVSFTDATIRPATSVTDLAPLDTVRHVPRGAARTRPSSRRRCRSSRRC